MKAAAVKINAKYQITIPKSVREKLKVKAGDRLLLDFQEGVIILVPEPESYTDHLKGLHREIWKDIDVQKYLNSEHEAWG